jgi:hypothetical protein
MLQFNLRTLFITTTTAAVLVWAFFAPPQGLGLLIIYLVYFLLPAATISGIVFHRGYWQAFFIGMAPWIVMVSVWFAAQIPWAAPYWPFTNDIIELVFADSGEIIALKLNLAIPLVVALTSGLVAVGIRWWALSAQRHWRRGL